MQSIKSRGHPVSAAIDEMCSHEAFRLPLFHAPVDQKKYPRYGSTGRSWSGFSLIEIMVVLLVLSVLATIAYPSYQESVRKTHRAEARAALMAAMQQQERYYSESGSYTIFSAAEPNGFKWFSGDSPASSSHEIGAAPCKDDSLRNCVVLTASPGTAKVVGRYKDKLCGDLTFSSNGIKGASGDGPNCW